jgi:TolA-binding protein
MDNWKRRRWLFFGAAILFLVFLAPAGAWLSKSAEALDQPAGDPGTAADPVLSESSLQQHLNQLFQTQNQELDSLQARLDLVSQDLQALPDANIAKFVVGQNSYYTGDTQNTMDAAPLISDGRVLVPVRYLADALGAQTDWDSKAEKVTISKGGTAVELIIGNATITVNSRETQMDAVPFISNGRTFLPARYVAESLGFTVLWDASTRAVTVSH